MYKGLTYPSDEDAKSRIACFDFAIDTFPQYATALYKKAETIIAADMGNENAVEHVKQILAFNPDHHYSYFLLGSIYMRMKQYEEAESNLKKCLDLQWYEYVLFDTLIRSQLEQGKFEEAVATLETAKRLNLHRIDDATVMQGQYALICREFLMCKQFMFKLLLARPPPMSNKTTISKKNVRKGPMGEEDEDEVEEAEVSGESLVRLKAKRLISIVESIEFTFKQYPKLQQFFMDNKAPLSPKFALSMLGNIQLTPKNPLTMTREESEQWTALFTTILYMSALGTPNQYHIIEFFESIISRFTHPKYRYVKYLSTNAYIIACFVDDLLVSTGKGVPKIIIETYVRTLDDVVSTCLELGKDPRRVFIEKFMQKARLPKLITEYELLQKLADFEYSVMMEQQQKQEEARKIEATRREAEGLPAEDEINADNEEAIDDDDVALDEQEKPAAVADNAAAAQATPAATAPVEAQQEAQPAVATEAPKEEQPQQTEAVQQAAPEATQVAGSQ